MKRESAKQLARTRRTTTRERERERPTSRVEDEVSVPELAVSVSMNLVHREKMRALISRVMGRQMEIKARKTKDSRRSFSKAHETSSRR